MATKEYYVVDPPGGKRFGFPKTIDAKEYTKQTFDMVRWLTKNGYPKRTGVNAAVYRRVRVLGPIRRRE